MGVFEELKQRDFIAQTTYEDELKEKLNNEKLTFYTGFDPTADSLHIGHFIQILAARKLQKAGHRPIILVGGATAGIGDPTGKQELRKVLDKDTLDRNIQKIREQLSKYISFEGENGAILVNNADWNSNVDYITYLREIGLYFSVNTMLRAECYNRRLETGLTFFEMGYMLIQANDFYHLKKNYNCILQVGGNDQWSNILAGADLIKKKLNEKAYVLSTQLLLTADGKKMGKSEKGAIWIDKEKTSPYEMYQILRNTEDANVNNMLKRLTEIDLEQIEKITAKDADMNNAKKILAYEFVKIVHGKEEADSAQAKSELLFSKKELTQDQLENVDSIYVNQGDSIIDICINLKLADSRGQLKTLIKQNGITLNDEYVRDVNRVINKEDFVKGFAILKKGKKNIYKLELK